MKDILRRSYDRSAPGYDERFWPLQRVKYQALLGADATPLRRVLDRGGRALDLGCGTGLLWRFLTEEGGASPAWQQRIVGLDLSFGMAWRARERGLLVVQGDLARLPFPRDAFGIVVAFTAFGIVPAQDTPALRETRRVLAPGGELVLSLLARDDTPAFRAALRTTGFRVGRSVPAGQDVGLRARG